MRRSSFFDTVAELRRYRDQQSADLNVAFPVILLRSYLELWEPHTLQQAIVYFSNPTNCREYVIVRRWPKGVTCPRCGSENVAFQEKYNRWQSNNRHDRRQFTVKTGTIFEDSPLGLDKWLTAMWMIANCKNGISSWEIHRAMKVTQKTAWFMLHRIRLAMQGENAGKLAGRRKLYWWPFPIHAQR